MTGVYLVRTLAFAPRRTKVRREPKSDLLRGTHVRIESAFCWIELAHIRIPRQHVLAMQNICI